jgi:GrpB-like predicted nucleotidyltransferase (UPF0157 family)
MHIEVQTYDPAWPEQFQFLKGRLEDALQNTPYLSIEHVGSTSVPGLAAKSNIDMDIVVTAEQLQAVKAALVEHGGYEDRGEMGIPLRYVFRLAKAKYAEDSQIPKHSLYVCIEGCQSLSNHLAVRDLCRADTEVRDAYGRKKLELGTKDWKDVDEYCEAKNDVVAWILAKAGFKADEVSAISKLNIRPA